MAIIVNDNFAVNIGKPIDSKYSNISTPWASVAAANAGIPLAYRYQGLTVNINGVEYWYKTGVADINLIIKSMGGSGTLTGATNGLTIVYSGTTVRLGGTLTGTTIITDGRVASGRTGIVYGGDYSTTFTNNSLVSKLYVDTIASGLQPKQAVQVATTGNIVLSGLTTIDGISVTAGQRVLVKNQISANNNGVWISSVGTWTRASDFNGTPSGLVSQGDYVWVNTGNTNGGSAWILTTPDPIIVNTTPMTFVLFSKISNISAGVGITVTPSGNTSIIALNTNSQAVINSAITGATNGLTKNGRNVGLGGNLCCNTQINLTTGYSFTISSGVNFIDMANCSHALSTDNHITLNSCCQTNLWSCYGVNIGNCGTPNTPNINITYCCSAVIRDGSVNCYGLTYAGDYSSTFVPLSLVTKQYVDAKTSGATGTITGATNGLSVTGKKIKLGGTLTGTTIINGGQTLNINVSILNLTGNTAFNLTTGNGVITDTGNKGGLQYAVAYDPYVVALSIPNAGWVTGCTSAVSTYAYNGLTKSGQCIGLGGTLTGNTCINLNNNSLSITGNTLSNLSDFSVIIKDSTGGNICCSYFDMSVQHVKLGYQCNPTYPYSHIWLDYQGINLYQQCGNIGVCTVYPSVGNAGLCYVDNYDTYFTNPRQIPDIGYVTGVTQSQSNTVNVYNQSVTAPYTATTTNDYIGAISGSTIYLPASGKTCQRISIADISGHALDCMIVIVGNGKCINGADCATVNTDYGSVTLINNGTFWSAIGFIN